MRHQNRTLQNRLILACMGMLTIMILLVGLSTGIAQYYLIWNIFLAYIPYGLAQLIVRENWKGWKSRLTFFVWLIFYPNAFYVITDLIHLQNDVYYYFQANERVTYVTSSFIWGRFLTLLFAVLISTNLSYHALYMVYWKTFRHNYSIKTALFFSSMVSLLTGVGIVLGRFFRLNTWDIFARPHIILEKLALLIDPNYIKLILLFTISHFMLIFFMYIIRERDTNSLAHQRFL
ncbi:DUF1361 domain-containing protein [Atopobacter phocae]|uniref:DUF1361 domain-containing protein n=1 Tax=Atopobacter phocae TaxID=136492 RepID=UPI00046EEF92|nr:DUF1361 domain-containing protein [Atopobacter phocae]